MIPNSTVQKLVYDIIYEIAGCVLAWNFTAFIA